MGDVVMCFVEVESKELLAMRKISVSANSIHVIILAQQDAKPNQNSKSIEFGHPILYNATLTAKFASNSENPFFVGS
jgi:hypothetical protein